MSGWFSIRITKAEALQGKSERLLAELKDLVQPDPAAGVFSVQVNDLVVDIYLSPAVSAHAGKVIHQYWAAPCAPPPSTARHLLGSASAIAEIEKGG
jgi:hypothetical protein